MKTPPDSIFESAVPVWTLKTTASTPNWIRRGSPEPVIRPAPGALIVAPGSPNNRNLSVNVNGFAREIYALSRR
jgi:hypothetical protein